MTVRELIEELKKHPLEMQVITRMCSDYQDLEPPTEEDVVRQDGRWIHYYQSQWQPARDGVPNVVRVLYFDGN